MKRISTALMLLGIFLLIQALGSDIAVDGLGGRRIANVGLMHDRLVMMILSGFVFFGGLLLRVFGTSLASASGSFLLEVDDLPKNEYWLRLATSVLVSGCVWLLLLMQFWSSNLAFVLLLAAVGWFAFSQKDTYAGLKRVWLATLILATVIMAFHVFVFGVGWINPLTLSLIGAGVRIVGSPNPITILLVLVGGPLAVSIGAFLYMSAQVKLTAS